MHDDRIERTARDCLAPVLDVETAPADLSLDLDLVTGYGLTSLNKVLFMTSVCDATGVAVSHFTEQDLASMRTLGDVVAALSRHAHLGTPR
jgi:acyl carrier protein